jgi:hypothetical protein
VRIGLGLVRCSLGKLGMIISLRLNIRLILTDRRRLRASSLRFRGKRWKYCKYEVMNMQFIWSL